MSQQRCSGRDSVSRQNCSAHGAKTYPGTQLVWIWPEAFWLGLMTGRRISYPGVVSLYTHVRVTDEEGSIDGMFCVSLLARLDVLEMLIGRPLGHQPEAMTHASQIGTFFHIC